jgi:LacI family transcriptional regulator
MSSHKKASGATIRDVAHRAQVSAMTVSRVINGTATVHPQTRERILDAIAQLQYVAKPPRHTRTAHPSRTLGFIVPNLSEPFFTRISLGVELAASRHGFGVFICNSHGNHHHERRLLAELRNREVDGILIAAFNDDSAPVLTEFMHHGCPLILIDREVPGVDLDVIQSDNVQGMRTLTQHLIALGHRRIAFMSSDINISTSRDRLHGYRLALDTAGIQFDATIVVAHTSGDAPSDYQAALNILQHAQRPDAIVTTNTITATSIVHACTELRLRIPYDIAMATFDDFEHTNMIFPFFTVAEQPTTLMGAFAVEQLILRIQDPRIPVSNIKLPTVFIERRSCGAAHMTEFFAQQFALR